MMFFIYGGVRVQKNIVKTYAYDTCAFLFCMGAYHIMISLICRLIFKFYKIIV